ncbi:nuclear transport factor 2 family protein [Paenibacillus whitsoniae]|uniref:Nuclear transport factor 2 family protein n=1 Tax=Paenibacillus whitsoniae TaxID=2496558 RepID=A0A3S0CCJ2_9BACL|nr:nuclear transport factor 2 family protein [Paenibacillus whitsoniae]RTE10801.1 nuclear transport factor 2 family protein [Paenibacillus whitsoniae]
MTEQTPLRGSRPREVVERFIQATAQNAWDELADLYAADVIIEIPFAPPGVPKLTEGGNKLRERFKSIAGLRRFDGAELLAMHETQDPEVVVVEWKAHGQVTATARHFTFSYIMVVRVRDGRIVSSRDYSNPIDGAMAFDRLSQLFEDLIGQGSTD